MEENWLLFKLGIKKSLCTDKKRKKKLSNPIVLHTLSRNEEEGYCQEGNIEKDHKFISKKETK